MSVTLLLVSVSGVREDAWRLLLLCSAGSQVVPAAVEPLLLLLLLRDAWRLLLLCSAGSQVVPAAVEPLLLLLLLLLSEVGLVVFATYSTTTTSSFDCVSSSTFCDGGFSAGDANGVGPFAAGSGKLLVLTEQAATRRLL